MGLNSDENEDNWVGRKPGAHGSESGVSSVGEDPEKEIDDPEKEIDLETEDEMESEQDDEEREEAWRETRIPVQPQPDTFDQADDYYDPKSGRKLSEKFKESGLQIIVKMASIELSPEKPEFPGEFSSTQFDFGEAILTKVSSWRLACELLMNSSRSCHMAQLSNTNRSRDR